MFKQCCKNAVVLKNRKIQKKYQQVALEKEIPDMVMACHKTKYSMRKMQKKTFRAGGF